MSFSQNLVSVSLPSTLTEIGVGAFVADVSLKEIEIPDGVTVIEQAKAHSPNATRGQSLISFGSVSSVRLNPSTIPTAFASPLLWKS